MQINIKIKNKSLVQDYNILRMRSAFKKNPALRKFEDSENMINHYNRCLKNRFFEIFPVKKHLSEKNRKLRNIEFVKFCELHELESHFRVSSFSSFI